MTNNQEVYHRSRGIMKNKNLITKINMITKIVMNPKFSPHNWESTKEDAFILLALQFLGQYVWTSLMPVSL